MTSCFHVCFISQGDPGLPGTPGKNGPSGMKGFRGNRGAPGVMVTPTETTWSYMLGRILKQCCSHPLAKSTLWRWSSCEQVVFISVWNIKGLDHMYSITWWHYLSLLFCCNKLYVNKVLTTSVCVFPGLSWFERSVWTRWIPGGRSESHHTSDTEEEI